MSDLDDINRAYEAATPVAPYREHMRQAAIAADARERAAQFRESWQLAYERSRRREYHAGLAAVVDWLDSRDTDPAPEPRATVLPDDDGGAD